MPLQLGILVLLAVIAPAGTAADAGLPMIILLPTMATIGMVLGAVQLMKFANRAAQRRIAAGEFPDLEALRLETPEEEVEGVLQGLAV
jgi:hypothetical protein